MLKVDFELHLLSESSWETAHVLLDLSVWAEELDVSTIDLDGSSVTLLEVLLTTKRGEAPVLGDNDLLATGELVLRSAESLNSGSPVGVLGTERQKDLANVDTGDSSVWLTPSTSHTSLQSIGTSARQHFVDTGDVEWMGTDSHVETVLSSNLDHVLVGANTGGFESLRRELFILVGDEMDAEWELVDTSTLTAQIEDTNLWVWDTSVEAGLWVWLVLAVTVATGWTAGHFDGCF
jgi:hypothetical protein